MTTSRKRLQELRQQAKELEEKIDQLEEQLNNAEPTTGLLGLWAKHPEYGNVLITMDRPLSSRAIRISHLTDEEEGSAQARYVNIDDLDFPDQTTRPEDVPVGEAWLVDAHNGFDTQPNTPALKIAPGLWVTPARETADESEWHNYEITLITPLIPARPQDTPETVTTEEEYEALPEGSVIVSRGGSPWTRGVYGWTSGGSSSTTAELAGTTRRVLRRGWWRE